MLKFPKTIKPKFDFYNSGGYFSRHITVIEIGKAYDDMPL